MERMKELISFSGSTCFEGAVLGKGVGAAITREEHVTTRWPQASWWVSGEPNSTHPKDGKGVKTEVGVVLARA